MKTFTIDKNNTIAVHASRKAARETGAGVFASEEQFADLIGPDNKRLLDIWNSLPGVKSGTKFPNRKSATDRIWKALQNLGEQTAVAANTEPQVDAVATEAILAEFTVVEPEGAEAEGAPEPERADAESARPLEDATLLPEIEPVTLTAQAAAVAEPGGDAGAQEPQNAAAEGNTPDNCDTPAKKARKTKKEPTAEGSAGPREGSKTAQVVAMLQRKNGATLEEIMTQMGWQKHTVRGFMAGAMKKAGHTVESFKSEKGERSYRIKS